ncbi:MAG: phosphonate degradation HD-domain oxygenase [Ramlibacter sp.]
MVLDIDDIVALYGAAGAAPYGMDAVTQEQHALQCATLAEQAGGAPALVAAALLHDVGHLVAATQPRGARPGNDLHEYVALPLLRRLLPRAVLEPIRLHVDAKRYLCAVEPAYHARLSAASRRSLALQGGAFSPEEAARFIGLAHAQDAVALRRWDDQAKDPAALTPGWAHFRRVLAQARSCPAPAA